MWCLEEVIKAFFSHVTNPWFDLGCSLGSYLRLFPILELEMHLKMCYNKEYDG